MVTPSSRPPRSGWLLLLLATGIVLTMVTVVLVVVVLTKVDAPGWLGAVFPVSPWGPIAIVTYVLVQRYRKRSQYLRAQGIPARAVIGSIGSTASSYGGRPVLKLTVSVHRDAGPSYPAMVRTAPPYHLAGLLRPGVSLPVKVHPNQPEQLLVDWSALERETGPNQPGRPAT
jgi:hypothetical protein